MPQRRKTASQRPRTGPKRVTRRPKASASFHHGSSCGASGARSGSKWKSTPQSSQDEAFVCLNHSSRQSSCTNAMLPSQAHGDSSGADPGSAWPLQMRHASSSSSSLICRACKE